MKRRFKTRKKLNFNKYKIILLIIIVIIIIFGLFKFLVKNKIKIGNEKKVNEYLALASNNLIGDIPFSDLINFNLISPDSFLRMSFNNFRKLDYRLSEEKNIVSVVKEVKNPTIYIYNTHQSEDYDPGTLGIYNITPTVYMASSMLEKALLKKGIYSVVEESSIKNILNKNNWAYSDSYKASRLLLEDVVLKYPSLEYFIDIHRDSVTKTAKTGDEYYANLMFVVGKNHENYEENERLVSELYKYIDENYPSILRKNHYRENSTFNQDFHKNTILIEVGGVKNTIDEVYNSINVFADAIESVIGRGE